MTCRDIVYQALGDPNVQRISASQGVARLHDVIRTLSATVGRDDIISVSASSEDPNMAAVIVNAVVRAYIHWHEANRQDSMADNLLSILHRQLETTIEALLKKRRELIVFELTNPPAWTTRRELSLLERESPAAPQRAWSEVTSRTLYDLKGELSVARLGVVERESYYARLRELESDPNRFRDYILSQERSVDDSERERLTQSLSRIRNELASAEPKTTSQIASLRERESQLVRHIAEFDRHLVRSHIALAESLCEDARARERTLAELYKVELAKFEDARAQTSQYELLLAECQMLEDQYNAILRAIRSWDGSRRSVRIHVLEWATPGVGSSLQMRTVLLSGLAFGLIAGTGLSLVWEWMSPTAPGGRDA